MAVSIKKVIDGNLQDIEAGKYNIFVPISLGNLYFTRERVRELVRWAIKHTKESVAILVADDIQAINYEVLKGQWKEEAQKSAKRLGDDFVKMAQRVVNSLTPEEQSKVTVARWADIEHGEFLAMQDIFKDEYANNEKFRTEIHRVVKETLNDKVPDNEDAINRLGDYVIKEMPLMFKGILVDGVSYDVFPYPGLNELDILVSDIQNKKRFPKIADRLDLTEKQPVIEAYVE